ncbi:sigma-70 family RNA polymerase sigma factor [Fimbriiglobus ruber]|uniref:RNA polymerase sigma factor RpoD n=1 Tax=Fimbriiglobus ruber TaxID=1908690 RepID=A0A225DCN2_9BACT|nr:RNA polymerase sigma factor RpoD/SigA [Fimbriiglobus ruber]OWK34145.1 RNA polymerase sigma factor RpoD [Fimbriiglobus ruber]
MTTIPRLLPYLTRKNAAEAGAVKSTRSEFHSPKSVPVGRNPFDTYLAEISRIPLLTRSAEKDLGHRIGEGDPAARDEMARANLRLVVWIAHAYAGKGLDLEDMVEEGNLGLLRAIEGFDPEMNTRFSTYATYWVNQAIRSALNKSGHVVRLPQYMGTLLAKWRQSEDELRAKLGREASREEVATHLGLTVHQTRMVAKGEKAIASRRATGVGGDEAQNDLLVDWAAVPMDELSVTDDVRATLEALAQLGDRAVTILRLRFGLDGGEPATLRSIGKQLGLTRERVRQLERDALADLRGRLER